ncbi:MAG: hypothetical protein J3Q66DRAFT_336631 [Benniella sp.]|nr:MAG: hypothetical protein J3Q66DRAFT_336631 [Benniella sp.]
MAAPPPGPDPVLTPSPVIPLPTTTTTTLSTAAPVPTTPSQPVPPEPTTESEATSHTKKTNNPRPQPTASGGLPPTTSNGPNPDPNNPDNKNNTDEKTNLGPIFGGIAAVLVLAFLTFVFVVRYKKKSKARKRRLDFLGDGNHSTGALGGAAALGGGGGGGGGASSISPPRPSGGGRPSTPSGGRPIEMSAVGAGASRLNEGYDYEQGYQQVPFGGYPDQHDQYDPYYAQHQQPVQGYYPDQQQQGYYPDQQQGYYPPEQQYQNQFMPPAHLGANNNNGYSQGTGSPSMTHITASPKSFPQPPLSSAGGFSAHGTPLQSEVLPEPSYEKFSKLESDSIPTHARNPQLIPENEERIKVPL